MDSTTLSNALVDNFSAVQNLFQSTSGVGQHLSEALTSLTNTVEQSLAVDLNGISSQVTDLNTQIRDFQLQLQNTQTQLTVGVQHHQHDARATAGNAGIDQQPA